ncbi:hypothetical protein G2W53_004780 [Senna tora]|uniref:Uncharacterized protein n=1 Tax=Senna tora TaxID=362788 RepID=A0A834XDX4_9FABA|nr:hypothetical protein G2W53_004780 [Senna tora]
MCSWPGLNWPGRASSAVTLKKLACSKSLHHAISFLFLLSPSHPLITITLLHPFHRKLHRHRHAAAGHRELTAVTLSLFISFHLSRLIKCFELGLEGYFKLSLD